LVLRVRGKRAFAIGAFCLAGTASGAHDGVGLVAPAWGQTEADLAAARHLFAEGLADEQAGRQSAALDKFVRVQAVRDTQAVRYRIATCLEALGQLRAALAAYSSTSVAASTDAEGASIARSSREKVEALSKRVARLVVALPAHAPPDAVVKIDGEVLQANTIGTPIVVDPGPHEITATGSGVLPFRAQMTLAEGGQTSLDLPLVAVAPPHLAPPLESPKPPSQESPPAPPSAPATPPPAASSARSTTTGVVFLTAGGVLLAGATAILLARHSDIQSLESACPAGLCPTDQEAQLEATRNRALIEGPVGLGVGAVGVVAAGLGVYFLATSGSPAQTAVTPWLGRSGGGLAWNVGW
jgi:hypothetical protein